MTKDWLVRGDCHSDFSWLDNHMFQILNPEETAIIILGDVGLNLAPDKQIGLKKKVNSCGFDIYCVRGNHEVAPYDMPNMRLVWDSTVNGNVWQEPEYPHLKYFSDYSIYYIKTKKQEYRTLVIGGAYSIDKFWRLKNNYFWYPNEQLTSEQMADCDRMIAQTPDKHFDFVFTHTCPMEMRPVDKFLPMVDQSTVDITMEEWLSTVENRITFNIWYAGHYHTDRYVDNKHILIYNCIDLLDDMYYWKNVPVKNLDR